MELIERRLAEHFDSLNPTIPNRRDYELAYAHAPIIRFDAREPFLPSVVGYTVFRHDGRSASFPRDLVVSSRTSVIIEYAIWWDWDIQHLYELEHIWVYLDNDQNVVAADASWHGGFHGMIDSEGQTPLEDGRVIVYSESGKHAFAPVQDWMKKRQPKTDRSTGRGSGRMGVHVTPLYEGIIEARTPIHNNLVHAYLESLSFEPTYDFSKRFDLRAAKFVPWKALNDWIPGRVALWADLLRETTPTDQYRPLRIAHRGASAYAQEGSSASVEKAAELGADMVEIDLRVTADDIPVIAHDSSLKRVFGVEGEVSELKMDELRARTPADKQPLLTFDEMLDMCSELELGLYLDIKETTPTSMASVIESLKKKGMIRYTIFGSFRPDLLAEIKAALPSAVTSILFSSQHVDPVALAASIKADYVHPCWERFDSPSSLLTEDWMSRVRGANLGIVCWHEERPEEIAALNRIGVDGICSDQPELLVRQKD